MGGNANASLLLLRCSSNVMVRTQAGIFTYNVGSGLDHREFTRGRETESSFYSVLHDSTSSELSTAKLLRYKDLCT